MTLSARRTSGPSPISAALIALRTTGDRVEVGAVRRHEPQFRTGRNDEVGYPDRGCLVVLEAPEVQADAVASGGGTSDNVAIHEVF